MIPAEYLTAYLWANGVALATLALAFRFRFRDAARWVGVTVFAWAAVINTWTALMNPQAYVDYATLTPSVAYRDFILGWFGHHVQLIVLPIAMGQAAIALLLALSDPAARRVGVAGAIVFLLAIAPLGVGSGFPFSLTFGAALLVSIGVGHVRTPLLRNVLRWAPRVLGLVVTLALGLLALDAFEGVARGPSQIIDAAGRFALHLIPAALALGVVALAWRRAWVGGAACFVLAIAYAVVVRGRIDWMLVVSVPLIVEGGLFLWSSVAARVHVAARTTWPSPRHS